MVGSRIRISAAACNIGIKDPNCWFDSSALLQEYELNLEKPFDRAIALLLLYIVPSHQTYILGNSQWYDDDNLSWEYLNLTEKVIIDSEGKRLDSDQKATVENLKKIIDASSDITKAVALFNEIDEDGSGELDIDEFTNLTKAIGIDSLLILKVTIFCNYSN